MLLETEAGNDPSQRAMLELGCVREGVMRNHFFLLDDHLRDTALFSINDNGRPAVCRDPGATCVRRRRH
ncbi:MAG: hypothetical protein JNN27_24145 [Planctomycetes bacterium]|nr:hypothetical protein [Planctomycetota bacterium]